MPTTSLATRGAVATGGRAGALDSHQGSSLALPLPDDVALPLFELQFSPLQGGDVSAVPWAPEEDTK